MNPAFTFPGLDPRHIAVVDGRAFLSPHAVLHMVNNTATPAASKCRKIFAAKLCELKLRNPDQSDDALLPEALAFALNVVSEGGW